MIAIVCAFMQEAGDFVDILGLKRISDKFVIFKSEDYILLLTGLGGAKAMIATTYLLSRYRVDFVINYGIGAATERSIPIGALLQANRIVDSASGEALYPDMLLDLSLQEGAILSVPKPLEKSCGIEEVMVDMESFGVAKAAMEFLPSHGVFIFKSISDYCEPKAIDKERVKEVVTEGAKGVIERLEMIASLQIAPVLDTEEREMLEKLCARYRFSVSQARVMEEAVQYRKLSGDDECLKRCFGMEFAERKRAYEALLQMLKSPV